MPTLAWRRPYSHGVSRCPSLRDNPVYHVLVRSAVIAQIVAASQDRLISAKRLAVTLVDVQNRAGNLVGWLETSNLCS